MALLSPDPKDVAAIRDAASQVIKDAIGQAGQMIAAVIVPAIAESAKSSMSGLSVNITVEPIKISIEIGEKQ